jgi:eukaryotic-like serine/threonine-protein kinase
MPSDSIAGFLEEAQASRVLFPEQIEQLIRQPDIPHSDLSQLCEYLLTRGVLTRFQAEAIRDSRAQELNFAGYPIVDLIGPCPGGTAYKALHPSLRTPIVLRRLRADWLLPTDNGANFVARARAFGMTPHANSVLVLDAGFYRDELYVVIDEPPGSADLETLAREVGGAMPGFLAAEYGRSIASVLRATHQLGGVHGDVRPKNLLVGPLVMKTLPDGTERRRPAPDAVVRLAELGLVPFQPPAVERLPDAEALAYLPPERIDLAGCDQRGDIYGLGASLYFVLTGRAPYSGEDASAVFTQIRTGAPTSLAALRPDLPSELVDLVMRMIARDPAGRPDTMYDVESALIPFCRPGTVPVQAVPVVVPMAAPASDSGEPVPEAIPVAIPEPEPTDGWGVDANAFSMVSTSTTESTPRKRQTTDKDRARTRMLIVLGGLLHLTGTAILIAYLLGAFKPSVEPEPPVQKEEPKKVNRPQRPPST